MKKSVSTRREHQKSRVPQIDELWATYQIGRRTNGEVGMLFTRGKKTMLVGDIAALIIAIENITTVTDTAIREYRQQVADLAPDKETMKAFDDYCQFVREHVHAAMKN